VEQAPRASRVEKAPDGTLGGDASGGRGGPWKLGDMTVNRLGLGAMRLTGSAAFNLGTPSDRDQSIRVLRRAVEVGVNHIDTAAFYFSSLRSAKKLINTALAPYPDDLVIATKVGPAVILLVNGWEGPAGPAAWPGRGEPAPARS
jgi:pyridoxine 4-dehydrogenase